MRIGVGEEKGREENELSKARMRANIERIAQYRNKHITTIPVIRTCNN